MSFSPKKTKVLLKPANTSRVTLLEHGQKVVLIPNQTSNALKLEPRKRIKTTPKTSEAISLDKFSECSSVSPERTNPNNVTIRPSSSLISSVVLRENLSKTKIVTPLDLRENKNHKTSDVQNREAVPVGASDSK
jgi:hypothetical protein